MSSFRSMGCTVELPDGADGRAVRALFAERDQRFSRFRADSELSRLNRLPAGASFVSDDFSQMLGQALRAARGQIRHAELGDGQQADVRAQVRQGTRSLLRRQRV